MSTSTSSATLVCWSGQPQVSTPTESPAQSAARRGTTSGTLILTIRLPRRRSSVTLILVSGLASVSTCYPTVTRHMMTRSQAAVEHRVAVTWYPCLGSHKPLLRFQLLELHGLWEQDLLLGPVTLSQCGTTQHPEA